MIQVNRNRFLLILFFVVCLIFITNLHHITSANSTPETTVKASIGNENDNALQSELSLMEAYQLALQKANTWSKEAQLVLETSVDDNANELAGTSGTRTKWNLIFADKALEETLLVSIENGTITKASTTKEKSVENTLIRSDWMKIDSTDVIENAKENLHLKPGAGWANGYHFSLMNNGKQTFMTVTGLNEENRFTQVFFDIQTGACIGSKVQSE